MATVALAVQDLSSGNPKGGALTYHGSLTAGDDYTIPNDGRTKVILRKAAGTASVVTFVSVKTVQGLAVADPTVTVAVNTAQKRGPFPVDIYGTTLAISGITNEANFSIAVYRD